MSSKLFWGDIEDIFYFDGFFLIERLGVCLETGEAGSVIDLLGEIGCGNISGSGYGIG